MSMQSVTSQNTGNGEVTSHVLRPDEVLSDDEDMVIEEEPPQNRAGVFSKFRSVCQNVFQSLIGTKQQRAQEKVNENAPRIIKRRSRQSLVTAGMSRNPSEAVMNKINLSTGQVAPPASSSLLLGQNSSNSKVPSNVLGSQATSSVSQEVGSRLAMPVKRVHGESLASTTSYVPFRGENNANQTFTAPWSALKQRRIENVSTRPGDTSFFHQNAAASRAAPVVEMTSLQNSIRETDRYSSMTLPSSQRPISREFGSAMSGETSSLTTPVGAKRRISLFETKTMSPHFNVEKMETAPYLDRHPARASPLLAAKSPRPQSPLAPRVVRLDMANKASPAHSPLVRGSLTTVATANPTAQRLARAYQQLTSATTRPQVTAVDPTRIHLIDPTQYFSRPKAEAMSEPIKIEPVSVKAVEPSKKATTEATEAPSKPAFCFAPTAEAVQTNKTNGPASGRFSLAAPVVLVDPGLAKSIWTCADCDIANSATNEYCFSCGRSKASSIRKEVTKQDDNIAAKRYHMSSHVNEEATKVKLSQPIVITTTIAEPPSRMMPGPSATSTPFVAPATVTRKVEEPPAPVSGKTATATALSGGGVVGQWRCSTCFFMNGFKAISCARCSRASATTTTNSDSSAGASSSNTPAVGASSRLKRRATLEGGWSCGCQHMNPRSATVCDLCNAPKPAAPAPKPVASLAAQPQDSASVPQLTKLETLPVSSKTAAATTTTAAPATPALPSSATVSLSTATATTTSLTAPIPSPVHVFGSGATTTTSSSDQTAKKDAVTTQQLPGTTASASTTTTSVAAPLPSTGFGDKFALKAGQWTCDVCMLRNDADKAKCPACEAPNPNAPAQAKASSEVPKFGMGAPIAATTASGGFSFAFTSTTQTKPAEATPTTSAPAMGGFKFGMPSPPSASQSFQFGGASTAAPAVSAAAPLAFGSLAPKSSAPAASTTTAATTTFQFGAAPVSSAAATAASSGSQPPLFGAPSATTAVASSTAPIFGMPAATTSSAFGATSTTTPASSAPAFGGAFGTSRPAAPQPTAATTTASSGSIFGSAPAPNAPLFGSAASSAAAPTSASQPAFSFGALATSASTSATSTGPAFAFGSTPAAPSAPFNFAGSSSTAASAPTTTTTSSGFVFGAAPAAAPPAGSAAPSAFNFGSTPASSGATAVPSTGSPFAFGSASQQNSTAPQTNGPASSLFAFGSSAPSTGGAAPAFGQPAQASQPFAFGGAGQQPAATSAAGAATAFNFASTTSPFNSSSTTPSNANTNNSGAASGGFKFDTGSPAPPAFNFSAGNPPAAPLAAAPGQSAPFVFGGGAMPTTPAAAPAPDGPRLFTSGAASVNRPKATAARKLKVAGRK